jgi:hypothetical protein
MQAHDLLYQRAGIVSIHVACEVIVDNGIGRKTGK